MIVSPPLQPIGQSERRFAARIRSVPLACHLRPAFDLPMLLISSVFHPPPRAQVWQPDCDYELRFKIRSMDLAMLGELTNISTDTLIDMLYIILAGEVTITASEVAEIDQIQRELQRRGGAQNWRFGTVN